MPGEVTHRENTNLSATPSREQLHEIGRWLESSRHFSHAKTVGELLMGRALHCQHASIDEPFVTKQFPDIDALLASLAKKYRTPLPAAYLDEGFLKLAGARRAAGAFYTPWPLAQYLTRSAAECLEANFPAAYPTWLDPACGGGVFFAALLRQFPEIAGRFAGWDSSPLAVSLAGSIAQTQNWRASRELTFECRDSFQTQPGDLPPAANNEPLFVIGNPPYSNFGKRVLSKWLALELTRYKPRSQEKKTNLRDTFLIFLRLAESLILHQGQGAIAMVLSTTFLDAITHSQVRASLLSSFDELRILRLQSPRIAGDENLFAIRQPTAACLFVRRPGSAVSRQARLFEATLAGSVEEKLSWLALNSSQSTPWREAAEFTAPQLAGPQSSGPQLRSAATAPVWYREAPPLPSLFREYISGVQTKNDSLFLARTRSSLAGQIEQRFGVFDAQKVRPILVAPFDPWWIYYDPALLGRARYPVMRHMRKGNLALVFMRQATTIGEYDHFLVTRDLVTDRVLHSRWGAPFLAPLYTWAEDNRKSNLHVAQMAPQDSNQDPEAWLAFTYALVHSHWYRAGAPEALQKDFPRIPPRETFDSASANELELLGRQLLELHAPAKGFSAFENSAAQENEPNETNLYIAPRYPQAQPADGLLHITINPNRQTVLKPISSAAWHYRIGGVEILKKFLHRRRRTTLFEWELAHLKDTVEIIEQTIQIKSQIDKLM